MGRLSSELALESLPEPLDRLVGNYRFAEIQRAIADMENGRVIKPILRMTNDELS